MNEKQLLRLKDVAALLSLHPESVRRLAGKGAIPVIRIGRSIRFRPEAIEKFIAAREIGGDQ